MIYNISITFRNIYLFTSKVQCLIQQILRYRMVEICDIKYNVFIRCLSFSELNHLIVLTVFFHWLILVAWSNFMFILPRTVLPILPSSFLARFIRRTFGWFKKFSLWFLIIIKQLDSALTSKKLCKILPIDTLNYKRPKTIATAPI